MQKTILAAFDLKDSTQAQYDDAYDALARLGLATLSPRKERRLPYSTVLGVMEVPSGSGAADVRDQLITAIEEAVGKEGAAERILVAEVSGWACRGPEGNIDDVIRKMLADLSV